MHNFRLNFRVRNRRGSGPELPESWRTYIQASPQTNTRSIIQRSDQPASTQHVQVSRLNGLTYPAPIFNGANNASSGQISQRSNVRRQNFPHAVENNGLTSPRDKEVPPAQDPTASSADRTRTRGAGTKKREWIHLLACI